MIRTDAMIPLLLEACPGFKAKWNEHVAYWDGEAAPVYDDLSEFVHYLMRAYEKGEVTTIEAAFVVLEQFFVEGDSSVHDYAALGIIETLQNVASHQPYTANVFIPFLKLQSLREWNAIEGMGRPHVPESTKRLKVESAMLELR